MSLTNVEIVEQVIQTLEDLRDIILFDQNCAVLHAVIEEHIQICAVAAAALEPVGICSLVIEIGMASICRNARDRRQIHVLAGIDDLLHDALQRAVLREFLHLVIYFLRHVEIIEIIFHVDF